MAKKLSAGLLLYRESNVGAVEVLLAHPGGPFWVRKDDGAWSIPKGEYNETEDPQAAAYREFEEEIGVPVPPGTPIDIGSVRQPSGKVISAFALEADLDLADFKSNTFELEWPRNSGKIREYPEVDRAEWMTLTHARIKLIKGQVAFLDRLVEHLKDSGMATPEL